MEITKVYPLDAVFDNPEDVPEDVMEIKVYKKKIWNGSNLKYILTNMLSRYFLQIKTNKRYAGSSNWTVQVQIHIIPLLLLLLLFI